MCRASLPHRRPLLGTLLVQITLALILPSVQHLGVIRFAGNRPVLEVLKSPSTCLETVLYATPKATLVRHFMRLTLTSTAEVGLLEPEAQSLARSEKC